MNGEYTNEDARFDAEAQGRCPICGRVPPECHHCEVCGKVDCKVDHDWVEARCEECGSPVEPGEKICSPCARYWDNVDRRIDEWKLEH